MATRAATVLPPFPYEPGSILVIKAHTPPPPFGRRYGNRDSVRDPVRGLVPFDCENQVDHMGFVISNPPLDPTPAADTEAQPSQVLTITQKVSHKPKYKGGGPIVIRGYLGSDESTPRIAKIYDGFEYELAEPGKKTVDCMYRADMDYSREAAAYEAIPERFQGSIVPRYFGLWTFPLPTGVHSRHRWVRMVLMEDVPGESMLDMMLRARGGSRSNPEPDAWRRDPLSSNLSLLPPEEERLNILARVIEADCDLNWFAGVVHCDVEPRNVIISLSERSNTASRVTLIDFNASYVFSRCEDGRQYMAKNGHGKGLPPLIIERYWFGSDFSYGSEYSEWLPRSWWVEEDRAVPAARWLVDRWIGSSRHRPPSEEFFNRPFHQYLDKNIRQLLEEVKTRVAKDQRAHG